MKTKDNDAYLDLGHAIILQAVRDYRSAHRKYKKNPAKNDYLYEMESIEKFFHSRLFGVITTIDPDELIKRLREEK